MSLSEEKIRLELEEKYRMEINELDELNKEFEITISDLEKENIILHDENLKLQEDNIKLKSDQDDLHREIDIKEKLILKMRNENNVYTDTIDNLRKRSLQKENELENRIVQLKKQIENLEIEKINSNRKIVQLENSIEDLEQSKREMYSSVSIIQSKFESLLEENAITTSENEVYKLSIERYKQELNEVNDENKLLALRLENSVKNVAQTDKIDSNTTPTENFLNSNTSTPIINSDTNQITDNKLGSPTRQRKLEKSISSRSIFERNILQKKNYLVLLKKFDQEMNIFKDLNVSNNESEEKKVKFNNLKNKTLGKFFAK